MFVLAHLSDPHLQMPAPPGLLELAGKRAIGYINWQRGRHTIHRTNPLVGKNTQSFSGKHTLSLKII